MTYFVYACIKCKRPQSIRLLVSKERPKTFKCFTCGASRKLVKATGNELALFTSEEHKRALAFIRKFKYARAVENGETNLFWLDLNK